MASTKIPTFKVTRKNPELIPPREALPCEIKYLSDVDDQDSLRLEVPGIQFYRKNPSMEGKDPVNVIRDAVAKALVFYYPLAGRLRECTGRKLVVECTGEGMVFVEANADIMLHHFGDTLYPPFPNLEELLPHIPGSQGIINCPLLFFQVTRLRCGGFILAYLINHTMCDGAGIAQFMSAVGELARGGAAPSIPPVWERHLLNARNPPRVSFRHHEYDIVTSGTPIPLDAMVQRSFFFSTTDISALRRSLPPHLQSCSKYEVMAACVWRCRTIAVSHKPNEETIFLCVVDIRKRMNTPLPEGYYGNGVVFPTAVTTAEKLSNNPLHYAVELVWKAKCEATDEYVRSVTDLIVTKDRPSLTAAARSYIVSDMTHRGFEQVEFGWGKAAYGGIAKVVHDRNPGRTTWHLPFKNKMGEEGIMVPVCLPVNAMEDFVKQLQMTMITARISPSFTMSPL
ncbi:hypothetical protein C2S51_035851 [Perilla frutescens var. frutescens]|nr:hypothetical protein C2S51_035851 [Perilla frutescens var. frutescens]